MLPEFLEGTPTATVLLDKPRQIAFTISAIDLVKKKFGTLEIEVDGPDTATKLPYIIWACLPTAGRRELNPEQIGDWIHPGNMAQIGDAIGALFKASLPDEKPNPTPAVPAEPVAAT